MAEADTSPKIQWSCVYKRGQPGGGYLMPVVESLPMQEHHHAHTLVFMDERTVWEILTQDRTKIGRGKYPCYIEPSVEAKPFETLVFSLSKSGTPVSKHGEMVQEYLQVDRNWRRDSEYSDVYSAHTATEEEAALLHDRIVELLSSDRLQPMHSTDRFALYGMI